MDIHDLINPLYYRYLIKDNELTGLIGDNSELGFLDLTRKVTSRSLIPRLRSLGRTLWNIASEVGDKETPERIDGIHMDKKIKYSRIFDDYSIRLDHRIDLLKRVMELYEKMSEEDFLSDLTYQTICALSVEANVANDMRHLMRDEIGEVTLDWGENRVGSSTMPHKVNPADLEQVVSFWKAYLSRVGTLTMGLVTEHQSDSTNQHMSYVACETVLATSYITNHLNETLYNLKILV